MFQAPTRTLLVTTGLAIAGLAASCGNVAPIGPGDVGVSWQVSPRGCSDAGVQTVRVELDGVESYSEAYDCASGEAVVHDVEPGIYTVSFDGIDEGGDAIFAARSQHVVVNGDELTEADFARLTAKPGTIGVAWLFDNGRVCGANGVDAVEVAVFDKLDYEVARHRFSCDAGEGTLQSITAGTYVVEAVGLSDGHRSHRGLTNVSVERGASVDVDVVLSAE